MATDRWYDDFEIGETIESPGKTMTESEIIAHALVYDPQPLHMDVQAAAESDYGGIIASGWHVGALAFRLFLAARPFADGASLGSPGVDELRWVRPVRPGDTIYVHTTVLDKRVSQSKPDRGLITLDWQILDAEGFLLMTMKSVQIVRLRPPDPA